MQRYSTVEAYIADFPPEVRARLEQIRHIIRDALPQASERISYQMPTFYQAGNIIHYAAWQGHIGIYPGASAISRFETRLQDYALSKGCIRLPLEQDIPAALITEICHFRLEENRNKIAAREQLRKKPAS